MHSTVRSAICIATQHGEIHTYLIFFETHVLFMRVSFNQSMVRHSGGERKLTNERGDSFHI